MVSELWLGARVYCEPSLATRAALNQLAHLNFAQSTGVPASAPKLESHRTTMHLPLSSDKLHFPAHARRLLWCKLKTSIVPTLELCLPLCPMHSQGLLSQLMFTSRRAGLPHPLGLRSTRWFTTSAVITNSIWFTTSAGLPHPLVYYIRTTIVVFRSRLLA